MYDEIIIKPILWAKIPDKNMRLDTAPDSITDHKYQDLTNNNITGHIERTIQVRIV